MHRADNVVSDSRELKEENEHIRNALTTNGYPDCIMSRPLKTTRPGREGG